MLSKLVDVAFVGANAPTSAEHSEELAVSDCAVGTGKDAIPHSLVEENYEAMEAAATSTAGVSSDTTPSMSGVPPL
jgi:hypothetical protein